MEEEREEVQVKDLTPASKRADILVKVLSLGERKTIDSRTGESRDLMEAVVGDETGTILMTLWEDQIDRVSENDVLEIQNGYVSLVRGHMRLNVGKYGSMDQSEQDIPEVNTEVDMSAQEFERERRDFGRRRWDDRGGYGEGRSQGRGRSRGDDRKRGRGRRRF